MMIVFCYLIPNFLADKHRPENNVFINTVTGLSLRGSSVTVTPLLPSFFLSFFLSFLLLAHIPLIFVAILSVYVEMFIIIENFFKAIIFFLTLITFISSLILYALHCTALHCTALHYTSLHCTGSGMKQSPFVHNEVQVQSGGGAGAQLSLLSAPHRNPFALILPSLLLAGAGALGWVGLFY